MGKALLSKYGCIISKVYPALLRQFYRDLIGDCSSALNLSEKEIDLHVAHFIELGVIQTQFLTFVPKILQVIVKNMMSFGYTVQNTYTNPLVRLLMTGVILMRCIWYKPYLL